MRKQVGAASPSAARSSGISGDRALRRDSVRALEIVATRGHDVVGVRHLLEGGVCWVGSAQNSIANISMRDFGGHAAIVGRFVDGSCTVHVPPFARARTHGVDGLGRLLMGPTEVAVGEGDRAVVVLGAIQIRARIIHIEQAGKVETYRHRDALKWLLVASAVYFGVFGICAVFIPDKPRRLEPGSLQRAIATSLEQAAEKARRRPTLPR
jgi:hypothetical protein